MGLLALNHGLKLPEGAVSGMIPPQLSYNFTSSNLAPAGSVRFIVDLSYMPQSGTSVAVSTNNSNIVVGGYDDGRYFFCSSLPSAQCPSGYTKSVSGFTTSADGGGAVAKSSDIPGLVATERNITSDTTITSILVPWGDPSVAAGPNGVFYFASLAIDPLTGANGVMIAQSNPGLLDGTTDCSTSLSRPSVNACWTPTFIYGNLTFQCTGGSCFNTSFEDKDLTAVDMAPNSPYYGSVYVAWDHFYSSGESSSFLARCSSSLHCVMLSGGTAGPLSGSDPFAAFSTPAVGSDGRVYVSWCNYGTSTTYGPVTCRVASAQPGGASFGQPSDILSFMGAGTTFPAYAYTVGYATEQFRTASIPTFAADGSNRDNLYFAIDVCTQGTYYPFSLPTLPTDNPGNCGLSGVVFASSTDQGATWSKPRVISSPAVNFQPSITVDPASGKVVVAYYTTQYDPFNHMVDVVAAVSTDGGSTFSFRRVTLTSNEPSSDPAMYDYMYAGGYGGALVVPQYGDYFQAVAVSGELFVLYTGNYVTEEGVFQTDPFLAVVPSVAPVLTLFPSGAPTTAGTPSRLAAEAPPGATVPFNATGFTPGATFTLSLNWGGIDETLATGTVGTSGSIAGNFTVPNVQSQVYTVTATDSAGVSASTRFGVEQVSLAPVQSSISQLSSTLSGDFASVQGSISSLSNTMTSGFSSVTSSLSGLSSTVTNGFTSVSSSISGLSTRVANGFSSVQASVANLSSRLTDAQNSIQSSIKGVSSQLSMTTDLVLVVVVLSVVTLFVFGLTTWYALKSRRGSRTAR